MAYHKWDAEYWEQECSRLAKLLQDRARMITQLQGELREVKERAQLLDVASRPIIFVQENSLISLPDYMKLMFTIVEYKSGYNKPELVIAHNPFAK